MKIRLSQTEDIQAIMEIYDVARQFMKDQGNPTQWDGGYPSASLIRMTLRLATLLLSRKKGDWSAPLPLSSEKTRPIRSSKREPGILQSLTAPFTASPQVAKLEAYPVRSLIFAASRFPICESIPMRTIKLCRLLF